MHFPPYGIKMISFFLFNITFKLFNNQEKFGGVRPLKLLLLVMGTYSSFKK
jgi:hypothetical protein